MEHFILEFRNLKASRKDPPRKDLRKSCENHKINNFKSASGAILAHPVCRNLMDYKVY